MVQQQTVKFVKDIEKLLDSVHKEREQVKSIIEEIIKKTYNQTDSYYSNNQYSHNYVGIKIYGSMASGLAIDSSDIDLAVIGLNFRGDRDKHVIEMGLLKEKLEHLKSVDSIKFIESATIPVIKLVIDLQKIRDKLKRFVSESQPPIDKSMQYLGIDITFEDQFNQQSFDQSIGVSQVNLGIQCISYIKTLCLQFTDLKPIVMVLKKLLQINNLNSPYHGGLSSYSLVLMTYAFLARYDVQQMGKNLTALLEFYGQYFNPSMTGIQEDNFFNF